LVFETFEDVSVPFVIVPFVDAATSVYVARDELVEYWKKTVVSVPLESPFPTTAPFNVALVAAKDVAEEVVACGAAGVTNENVFVTEVPVPFVADNFT
jgi:hypothetical protein